MSQLVENPASPNPGVDFFDTASDLLTVGRYSVESALKACVPTGMNTSGITVVAITSSSPVSYIYQSAHISPAPKPLLRGWMHLLWFEASLVVGTLLIATTSSGHRVGAAIYAGTVSGLFGTSALYHRGNWKSRTHRLLQRLDHTMIFLLIAGSATPLILVTMPASIGTPLLIVLWASTVFALVTHLVWMPTLDTSDGATFASLGLLGSPALPAVWMHSGVAAFALILCGGLLYLVGAVLYHRRTPDPRPDVFGFHEVFHSFVCAAATLQYVGLSLFIL
jgi:hemolysin III